MTRYVQVSLIKALQQKRKAVCNHFVHNFGRERNKVFYPHLLAKDAYYNNIA